VYQQRAAGSRLQVTAHQARTVFIASRMGLHADAGQARWAASAVAPLVTKAADNFRRFSSERGRASVIDRAIGFVAN
jgi:hypothetical protein